MNATLVEVQGEEGVGVDRCDEASSIGGLVGSCGQDTQPECRAFGARLWAWKHGGTSWQQVLCIFLQYPLV